MNVVVRFENYNRSREVSSALRYYHKTACTLFHSGMRRCAMDGKSHVITTWDSLEEAQEAASYLAKVQLLGCYIEVIE